MWGLSVTEQIKIRAQTQGEITDIRILMQHPMETGQRKDDNGQTLPMHFIQTFTVSLNGKSYRFTGRSKLLFALLARLGLDNGLRSLSMGMSADFPIAIRFGATHVRVGSAIFGART